MGEWRPISTAPKDGDILVYADGEQFVAFWGTAIEDGSGAWVFARGINVAFIVRSPTHWQPLPAPPKEGSHAA